MHLTGRGGRHGGPETRGPPLNRVRGRRKNRTCCVGGWGFYVYFFMSIFFMSILVESQTRPIAPAQMILVYIAGRVLANSRTPCTPDCELDILLDKASSGNQPIPVKDRGDVRILFLERREDLVGLCFDIARWTTLRGPRRGTWGVPFLQTHNLSILVCPR